VPHYVPVSAHLRWNLDELLEKMWTYLNLIRMSDLITRLSGGLGGNSGAGVEQIGIPPKQGVGHSDRFWLLPRVFTRNTVLHAQLHKATRPNPRLQCTGHHERHKPDRRELLQSHSPLDYEEL